MPAPSSPTPVPWSVLSTPDDAPPAEVAVVVPVRDGEHTLARAIRSLVAQQAVALEIVVVDDGSTDQSASVAAGFGEPVRVLSQRWAGVSAARNAGAAASRSPLLAFVDADDEVEPGWAAAMAAAVRLDVGLVSCGVRRHPGNGAGDVILPHPLGPAFGGIIGGFLAGSWMVRREVFEKAGAYDCGLRFGENFELGLRIGRALGALGLRAAVVGEPLVVWHGREQRGHHPMALLEGAEHVLRRHGDLLARDPKLLADHRAVAGVNAARVGDLRAARRHFLAGARARPSLRAGTRLAAAFVPALASRAWPPAAGRPPRLPAPAAHALGEVPTATVVIGCHNGGDELLAQVRALAPQLSPGASELVIADNASGDGSVERALALGLPLVRAVRAAERRGQAYARNEGARAGTGQVVLFLDHDDRVHAGYVDAMRAALASHPAAGARLSLEALNDPATARTRRPAQADGLGEGLFPWAYGGALGIDRALFDALGGFDEDLSPGEDVDLCFRMQERYEADLAFVPDAVLDHRLRRGARAILHQGRAFGRAGPELYLRHRRHGLGRDPLPMVVRLWAGLARGALAPDRGRRWEALFMIGTRAGRLEGSLRRLVWYP